jgi:hypothetical protein
MFLGLSIRPVICLHGQSIVYKKIRLIIIWKINCTDRKLRREPG